MGCTIVVAVECDYFATVYIIWSDNVQHLCSEIANFIPTCQPSLINFENIDLSTTAQPVQTPALIF